MATEQNVRVDEVAVEMRNIVKKFGDFTANDGINLVVHKGEIHAILGENGAGKSTLMNQLYGMYTPTSGEILIGGEPTVIDSPKTAIAKGIGMVISTLCWCSPSRLRKTLFWAWSRATESSSI